MNIQTHLAPAKVALVVMGVGRSGTSALTRVLSLLGAGLPREIIGPGPANQRGHWEPNAIVGLSNEMLRIHDKDWFDFRAFPADWFNGSQARSYIDRASALIQQEYGEAPLIVIKDPRICRLGPIYFAALYQAGYAPHAIIPVRYPGEIAGSLIARDGTEAVIGELIWVRHILDSEAATRAVPRIWTTYDDLLEDWRSVVANIASEFALDWPRSVAAAELDIESFLDRSLRHFDSRIDHGVAVGLLAARLWQAVRLGPVGYDWALRSSFDEVRRTMEEFDRLGDAQTSHALRQQVIEAEATHQAVLHDRDALHAVLARKDQEIEECRASLTDKDQELGALRTAAAAQHSELALHRTVMTDRNNEIDSLGRQVRETTRNARDDLLVLGNSLAAKEMELQQISAIANDRDKLIHLMLASRSWRLTGPFRTARSALKRSVSS